VDLSAGLIAQIVPTGAVESHDQIMLGIVALLGTLIATFAYVVRNGGYARTAAHASTEANKAVNNVGPGEHRLYDVIGRIEAKQDEFDRKWGNLPADMGDAVGLAELIHGMDKRISQIQAQLVEHVQWEMQHPREEP
jgi:hypothetical protein